MANPELIIRGEVPEVLKIVESTLISEQLPFIDYYVDGYMRGSEFLNTFSYLLSG